jgi:GT2 family glycosyltransferase
MNAGSPLVSIVTHNATRYVHRCLESLQALTTTPHEALVVDNASRADTVDYLRSVPGIRLQLNTTNRWWCPALNQALAAADGGSRYFLPLNPDVEILRADWLDRLVAMREAHPRTAFVGTTHYYRPFGPTFGAIDGDCFLMRRAVYEDPAIGPLDENYPWVGAPYVLTVKAWAKGWRYRVHPPYPRLIHHYGGRSRAEADHPLAVPRLAPLEVLGEAGLAPWRESRIVTPFRRALIRHGFLPRLPAVPV